MRFVGTIQTLVALLCLGSCFAASADPLLSAAQAASHIGEHAKVCGVVASAKYAARSKGSPTFLNLDKPYPAQIFTAVIWGDARDRFPTPPESLAGEVICVDGVISSFRGTPEIIVSDPSQITRPRQCAYVVDKQAVVDINA